MVRALLTGGAGYLGSVLCEHLLHAGFEVTVIDKRDSGHSSLFHLCAHPRFDFIFGDVRDKALMSRLICDHDILVPLAALVGAPACEDDPAKARSINVEAVQLLNQLRSRDQLVIFPTTNSGYGTSSGETHCTEETCLEPESLYGKTKQEAERELLTAPNAISLRLASVFGMSPCMRLDLLVNHFVYTAVKDGYMVIFEKDFKRNFIHIRDVAECVIHCIKNSKQMVGKAFNLGLDDQILTKEQLALKVKDFVPGFYIHFAEISKDPDKRNYIVSSQKIRETGFEPQRSLDDGIRELLKGYRMMGITRKGK